MLGLTGNDAGVGDIKVAAVSDFPPGIVPFPRELLDIKNIRTQGGDAAQKGLAQSLYGHGHEGNSENSNYDPERGQNRAQFVSANGRPGDAEALTDFGEHSHRNVGSPSGRGNPSRNVQ